MSTPTDLLEINPRPDTRNVIICISSQDVGTKAFYLNISTDTQRDTQLCIAWIYRQESFPSISSSSYHAVNFPSPCFLP